MPPHTSETPLVVTASPDAQEGPWLKGKALSFSGLERKDWIEECLLEVCKERAITSGQSKTLKMHCFRGSNLLDTFMIPKPQSGEKLALFPVKAEEAERIVQSPVNITDLK